MKYTIDKALLRACVLWLEISVEDATEADEPKAEHINKVVQQIIAEMYYQDKGMLL